MDRIDDILINDKFTNLQQIAEILQAEVFPLAQNFFLLSKEPVVRFHREGDKYVFNIEIEADRVKPFGCRI